MQLAVPEVTDISKESEATRESYGLNGKETKDFGRSCLLARRMLEQGVTPRPALLRRFIRVAAHQLGWA